MNEGLKKFLWHLKPHLYETSEALSARLGYSFKSVEWLYEALTHSSAVVWEGRQAQEGMKSRISETGWNERLEFLGDSILGLTIAEHLCHNFQFSEGEMSRIKAALVCETTLAEIAKEHLNLGEYLVLGTSELNSQGRNKPSILADAMEAVIGAVFSDGGWQAARALVHRLYEDRLQNSFDECLERDHKTMFQEVAQARFRSTPTYDLLNEKGPSHNRLFEVAVYLNCDSGREEWGRGVGTSKKRAAQIAAANALERLKDSCHD